MENIKYPNELICVGNITPANNDKIHQRNWVYHYNGICPTETSTQFKDPVRVLVRVKNV